MLHQEHIKVRNDVPSPAAGVDVQTAFISLLRERSILPLPGGGRTIERWHALARVAAFDLSVAKLYLPVFMRQSHGERDFVELGRLLAVQLQGASTGAQACTPIPADGALTGSSLL